MIEVARNSTTESGNTSGKPWYWRAKGLLYWKISDREHLIPEWLLEIARATLSELEQHSEGGQDGRWNARTKKTLSMLLMAFKIMNTSMLGSLWRGDSSTS